jgi:hypothetical protein
MPAYAEQMKTLLALALATFPATQDPRCHTFTDGNRIYDFEFSEAINVHRETCNVSCEEGQCTFYCGVNVTTVFDTQPPMAMDMLTGKVTLLEPLCQ